MRRKGFIIWTFIALLLAGLRPVPVSALSGADPEGPRLLTVSASTSNSKPPNWARTGETITVQLAFNKRVYYASGSLKFQYGAATGLLAYAGGSGTDLLSFTYQVPPAATLALNPQVTAGSPSLQLTGWDNVSIDDGVYTTSLPDGSHRRVAEGNVYPPHLYSADSPYGIKIVRSLPIFIDNVPPRITGITSNAANRSYGLGETIYLIVQFSERVSFDWNNPPVLMLNNGAQTTFSRNTADWPVTVDPTGDSQLVLSYTPQPGQSVTALNAVTLLGSTLKDQAGLLLDRTLPTGSNLADTRSLRIDVPAGQPQAPPYIAIQPLQDTLFQKDPPGVKVTYVSNRRPLDEFELWYYWDQNPDPAAAQARWDAVLLQAYDTKQRPQGIAALPNGTAIPRPPDASGLYYLHVKVRQLNPYYFPDFGGTRTATHWDAGPFAVDNQGPAVSFTPAGGNLPPRYFVRARATDDAGVASLSYQWQQLLPGGGTTDYGSPGTPAVDGGAWVMAPADAGQYQVKITATDGLGQQTQVTSPPFSVTADALPPNAISKAQITWGTEQAIIDGRPTSQGEAYVNATTQNLGGLLGQVFYLWSTAPTDPTEPDPRWHQLYDGLGGQNQVGYRAPLPDGAASGTWYLHAKAYDQSGAVSIATLSFPVLLDQVPPVVSVTPNGSGPVKNPLVKLQVSDNMTTDPSKFAVIVNIYPVSDPTTPIGTLYPSPADAIQNGFSLLHFVTGKYFLVVEVHDEAWNVTTFTSQPFYLENAPPQGASVRAVKAAVSAPRAQIELNAGGKPDVQYDYVVDNGKWITHPIFPGDEGAAPTCSDFDYDYNDPGADPSWTGATLRCYVVRPDAVWSSWLPLTGAAWVDLPHTPGEHVVSARFQDAFGNRTDAASFAAVTYDPTLPPEPPTASLSYSTTNWTYQDVRVTLNALDAAGQPVTVTNNGGSNTYTFTENGRLSFEYRDGAGHTGSASAAVTWIDKLPPIPLIRYSTDPADSTRDPVLATVFADEPITVRGEDGSTADTHRFADNGSYTFTVQDRAGNTAQVTASVANIDRTPPQVTVAYSTATRTAGQVLVTLTADKPFIITGEPPATLSGQADRDRFTTAKTYVFQENSRYTFQVRDQAGNSSAVPVSVSNINPAGPQITLVYSTSSPTRDNVTVTLLASDPITVLDDGGQRMGSQLLFTANAAKWVRYLDAENVERSVRVEVRNIDRAAPQIRLPGGENLLLAAGGAYNPLTGVQVIDNLDGDITGQVQVTGTVDTATPGAYPISYKATDQAGNAAVLLRTVVVLPPGSFQVFANAKAPDAAGEVRVSGDRIRLDAFGTAGTPLIRWAEGKQGRGYFKGITGSGVDSGGNRYGVLAGNTLSVSRGGWYTFYLQDQERQSCLLQVYLDYQP